MLFLNIAVDFSVWNPSKISYVKNHSVRVSSVQAGLGKKCFFLGKLANFPTICYIMCFYVQKGKISLQIPKFPPTPTFPEKELPKFSNLVYKTTFQNFTCPPPKKNEAFFFFFFFFFGCIFGFGMKNASKWVATILVPKYW